MRNTPKSIVVILFTLLSMNTFSADYYKCKPEKSYVVSDDGTMKENWLKGAGFTIDRATGEYRSFGANRKFKVIDKGDSETNFRAVYDGGWGNFPLLLSVKEYSDSLKKPYIIFSPDLLPSVKSGLCEKF